MKEFKLVFENKPFVPDVPKAWLDPATAQPGVTLDISVTEWPNGPFSAPVPKAYRFEVVQVIYAFSGDHNGIAQTDATPATLVLAYVPAEKKLKKS